MKTRTGNDTYLFPVDMKRVVAATDGSNSVSPNMCVCPFAFPTERERGGGTRGERYIPDVSGLTRRPVMMGTEGQPLLFLIQFLTSDRGRRIMQIIQENHGVSGGVES